MGSVTIDGDGERGPRPSLADYVVHFGNKLVTQRLDPQDWLPKTSKEIYSLRNGNERPKALEHFKAIKKDTTSVTVKTPLPKFRPKTRYLLEYVVLATL